MPVTCSNRATPRGLSPFSLAVRFILMTSEQMERLKLGLRKKWQTYEKNLIEKATIADGHVAILKKRKSELILLLSRNPDMEADIK